MQGSKSEYLRKKRKEGVQRFPRWLAFKILHLLGKEKFQPIWELINRISLAAMNVGGGSYIDQSGERFVLKFIMKKFNFRTVPIVVFDVGANIGEYTRAVIDCFGSNAVNIYCFEPSRNTFKILESNFKNIQNVRLFNFGLGEKDENVTLFSFNEFFGNASLYNRRIKHLGFELVNREDIELKSLDNFCAVEGISHIHLLKIDVEGHELAVLKGGKEMIEKGAIDFIQFEFGGCNIDSRTFFQDFFYLLNDKYHIFRILKDGLFTIEKYKETYELFLTTNYLTMRRELVYGEKYFRN